MNKYAPFETLKGLTLVSAMQTDDHELVFITDDGRRFEQYHLQDCCESVTIESIVGDLNDLIGTPILLAEESISEGEPDEKWGDSMTWSFYKLATTKGYVDIRWYGTSNGYYSERVDLYEVVQ